MDLKLYYGPGACSLASHIALEEAGFAYETQKLNLQEGDQRKPEYLKLNPNGRVPTLVVDGKPLTENVAILTFIGGGFPDKGLWPKDTWSQAMLVSALAWCSNTIHPAYGHLVRASRYSDDPAAQETIKAKARQTFGEYLKQLDGWLGKTPKWMMGKQFTVGDGYLLVFYRWANRNGYDVKAMANYTRHANDMLARPAVKKVMADEGITMD